MSLPRKYIVLGRYLLWSISEAIPLCRSVLLTGLLLWPWGFITPNVLKACGDVKFIFITNIASMWVFRVLAATILVKVFGLGLWGIWLGTYLSWVYRGVVYLIRFRIGKWKIKKEI